MVSPMARSYTWTMFWTNLATLLSRTILKSLEEVERALCVQGITSGITLDDAKLLNEILHAHRPVLGECTSPDSNLVNFRVGIFQCVSHLRHFLLK